MGFLIGDISENIGQCRLDLAPPLADRFILGIVPIDCSPALLLMPFGFHLTVDTCPPEHDKQRIQIRLGCIQLVAFVPVYTSP